MQESFVDESFSMEEFGIVQQPVILPRKKQNFTEISLDENGDIEDDEGSEYEAPEKIYVSVALEPMAVNKRNKRKRGKPSVQVKRSKTELQSETFPCMICEYKFTRKANMLRHLETTHEK